MARSHPIQPNRDRVLVRVHIEDKTPGGIILPQGSKKERFLYATVLASGPGRYEYGKFVENTIKDGDRIVVQIYDEQAPFKYEGEELYIIPMNQVMAHVS